MSIWWENSRPLHTHLVDLSPPPSIFQRPDVICKDNWDMSHKQYNSSMSHRCLFVTVHKDNNKMHDLILSKDLSFYCRFWWHSQDFSSTTLLYSLDGFQRCHLWHLHILCSTRMNSMGCICISQPQMAAQTQTQVILKTCCHKYGTICFQLFII